MSPDTEGILSPSALLEHWQGHRRLTRRTLEAFPEEHLFTYHVEGMRPFGELMGEVDGMLGPTLQGMLGEGWHWHPKEGGRTKAEALAAHDEASASLDARWAELPTERFQEVMTAFGQWTMPGVGLILYLIDNEIHHRAQGYVYLRLLGIEPPAFYKR